MTHVSKRYRDGVKTIDAVADVTLSLVRGTLVVLRAVAAADGAWPALAERALRDPGLAVVSSGQHDAPYRVRIDGERMTIAPHDIDLQRPEWLTTQRWDHFDELLRQPVRAPSIVVPPPAMSVTDLHALPSLRDHALTLDDEQVPEPTREVRVLGPLEVSGIPAPNPAEADLLAYLATHRAGATTELLAAQLGCDPGQVRELLAAASGATRIRRDLAVVLRTGAHPLQLEFAQSQSISPTLGRDSLVAGLQAGFIGLLLVALYMIALYRGLGALAVLELVMFGVLVYGLIIVMGNTVGFTLTLAGIAGVIVSIGIAADSSIIYRERYRDERRAGRTVRSAAEHAFGKAFRTNLTGNTVSFLAAVVLWLLAVGPVKGFAFTLGLSTLIDTLLFATFTRSTFGLLARSPRLANASWTGLRTVAPVNDNRNRRQRQKVKSR